MSRTYIKWLIRNDGIKKGERTILEAKDIPDDLVEAKRMHLKIKRLMAERGMIGHRRQSKNVEVL